MGEERRAGGAWGGAERNGKKIPFNAPDFQIRQTFSELAAGRQEQTHLIPPFQHLLLLHHSITINCPQLPAARALGAPSLCLALGADDRHHSLQIPTKLVVASNRDCDATRFVEQTVVVEKPKRIAPRAPSHKSGRSTAPAQRRGAEPQQDGIGKITLKHSFKRRRPSPATAFITHVTMGADVKAAPGTAVCSDRIATRSANAARKRATLAVG